MAACFFDQTGHLKKKIQDMTSKLFEHAKWESSSEVGLGFRSLYRRESFNVISFENAYVNSICKYFFTCSPLYP